MLASVLIANRGEIACRIIRTARRLGVRAIAVHSEADAGALHVRAADAAVAIGGAAARESYLSARNILAAARQSGAAAVHPGYGFLAENAEFAEAVLAAGLIWIGPPPDAIRAMGLKDAAKKRMAEAGVPTTPGYLGGDQSSERLQREAAALGYPVLIKAVAGGGGKGMRKVAHAEAFEAALRAAKREAAGAFGDDRVLLETYVRRPRHIEVQVFADAHGNAVHLFERDCSLQRRHQKVVEEAPAPGMDEETRAAVCEAAVRAARAVNYVGAGTVEFIADASEGLRADRIWFMEMNTRLQVEHPVTEAITGLDLVEWQMRVASGERLPLAQNEIVRAGAAVEARLYAENPETGFLPSIGPLEHLSLPSGVRIDAGVEQGDVVSAHYDPMIAKLIAHGPTREAAIDRLARACAAVEVWPVRTNAGFLARTLAHPVFRDGDADTGFIEAHLEALTARPAPDAAVLSAAALALAPTDAKDPWSALRGFRLNAEPRERVRLQCGDAVFEADLKPSAVTAIGTEEGVVAFAEGEAYLLALENATGAAHGGGAFDGAVRAPMPGKIAAVHAAEGERVKAGAPIATLEAMKMEHVLAAPVDGVLAELRARAGAQVSEGDLLARLEPDA